MKDFPVKLSFSGKHLATLGQEWEEMHGHKPNKTPHDFEQLQAYLAAFGFKWRIEVVHDEPCGEPWKGGQPQIRIKGRLEGNGVKSGNFEVTFHGRRIEVGLPPERHALFEHELRQIVATITCPMCGIKSTHPLDIEHKYCGNCKMYHKDMC